MNRIIIFLIAGILAVAACWAGYYLYDQRQTVTIVFYDSKNIEPKDKLYLQNRFPVGMVKAVKPRQDKVAIIVHIDKAYRNQFTRSTAFFISSDENAFSDAKVSRMCIQAKIFPGVSLEKGDQIDGIDSPVVWFGIGAAKNAKEILAEPWDKLANEVGAAASEMEKKINEVEKSLKKRMSQEDKNP